MPVNVNELNPAVRAELFERLNAASDPLLQEAFDRSRTNASLGALITSSRPADSRRQGDFPEPRKASGMWDAMSAGWQNSTAGLILRQESPDVMLDQEAPRAERLAMMASMMIGDLPTLLAGGISGAIAGAPLGPVGSFAASGGAAFGLTEGIRTWLLEQYAKGYTQRDLSERIAVTAWATAKGTIIGTATGAAGAKTVQVVRGVTSPVGPVKPMIQSGIGQSGAITAAELVTMVGVAAALEGELPSADDFLDAAIVLGGLKGAIGVSGKMAEIYRRTGKRPDEVMAEAHRDPRTYQQLIDDTFQAIPEKFRTAEQSPLRPPTPEGFSRRGATVLEKPVAEKTAAVAKEAELVDLANNPFRAQVAQIREKHMLNIERMDMKEGPKAFADELANIYRKDMEGAQRGRVSWERTDAESMAFIREVLGEKGLQTITEQQGTTGYAARVNAIRDITVMTLNQAWEKASAIANRGREATPAELADMMASFERAQQAMKAFRGEASEIGRALNILKKVDRIPEAAAREAEILKMLEQAGGKQAAADLAKIIAAQKDPAAVGKMIRQPTLFEMTIEGIKSFMLSGPSTMQINVLGNLFFGLTRVPKEVVAATISKFKPKSAERVAYTDAIAMTTGMVQGAFASIRSAAEGVRLNITDNKSFSKGLWKSYKEIGLSQQAEQRIQNKIPGVLGEVIRAPFKVLTATDLWSRSMNHTGTLYNMASQQAIREGITPLSKTYWNRVNELAKNPTAEMQSQANKDALRYVFLEEAGPIVKALENLRNDLPALHVIIPFLKVPGSIFREFFKNSPLAPIVSQWRAEYAKGGAARDRALAEVAMGTSIGLAAFTLARDGVLTGGGHPDRRQRRADLNAGFQPYSVKTADGTYISINRMEPGGTLLGLAADLAMAWDIMDDPHMQDKAASALMWAATEVVQNKTWLAGVSALINAISDPERYGEAWLESIGSLVVPNIMGQTAREMDPYVREIDSITSAIQAKIPGMRQNLPVVYDDFGDPVNRAQGLWAFAPSTKKQQTTDKVRSEAARLGVATSGTPRQLQAASLLGAREFVDLSDEQRDIFAQESGKLAYDILSNAVNSPGWDNMPKLVQRRYYERAFMAARRRGALAALPPEERVKAIQGLRDEWGL